jgi:serine/threonine protein kinase
MSSVRTKSMFCSNNTASAAEQGTPATARKAFCLQEFCNGGNLRRAVDRGYFSGAFRNRWKTITQLLTGVVAGMEYVHSKRILHGDLNPSNILLKVRALLCFAAVSCLSAVCSLFIQCSIGHQRRLFH